jgi:hypothetical protein
MNWDQIWTIIGVNIALFGGLISVMIWITTKHDSEMKSIVSRLDGHATRIDQLYQMFIDLLKEKK